MFWWARRNRRFRGNGKRAAGRAFQKTRGLGRVWAVESLESRAMLSVSSGDVNVGILLLDRSAPRAFMNTGSGGVQISSGGLVINSSDTRAGVNRGSGNISASEIDVTGGLAQFGPGRFQGAIANPSPMDDPLADLPAPILGFAIHRAVNVAANRTFTLTPGTYVGGIHIAGNAKVILQPGVYCLQGGGLSVRNNGMLAGNGVLIYNNPRTAAGSINFSDNCTVALTASNSGDYQGIAIFQNRLSIAPLTVAGGGVNVTGEVYAPKVTLSFSSDRNFNVRGNAAAGIAGAVIINRLNSSGSGRMNVDAASHTTPTDLSVTITDDGSPTLVPGYGGAWLDYFITVTNNGPTKVVGAKVSDVFPQGFESFGFTISPSPGATTSYDLYYSTHGSYSDPGFTDTISLEPGASILYSLRGEATANAVGQFTNTARVVPSARFKDTDPTNNVAIDSHQLTPQASLSIAIDSSVPEAVPGSTVVYNVRVSSGGPSKADHIAVSGSMPVGIASFSVSGTDGFSARGVGGDTFVDSNLFLRGSYYGDSAMYTVTAVIDSSAGGPLTTSVEVAAPPGVTELYPENHSATRTIKIGPAADLVATMTGPDAVVPGTSTTYTITVANNGPNDVVGAHIVDNFPTSGSVFIQGTGTLSSGTIGGSTNSGTITIGNFSGNQSVLSTTPNSGNLSLTVNPNSAINSSVTVTNSAANTFSGGTVTYSGGLAFNGAGTITIGGGDHFFDYGLRNVTYTAQGTGDASGFTASGSGNIDDIVNLAVGASITYTVSADVAPWAGNFLNTVTVTTPESVADPDLSNNIATVRTYAHPQIDLDVSLSDNTTTAFAGVPTTYTLTVTNRGPSDASDATVRDIFPDSIAHVSYTATASGGAMINIPWYQTFNGYGQSVTTKTGTGHIIDSVNLPAGALITYQISALVALGASGDLTNTATIEPPYGMQDSNPNDNSATDTDSIQPPDDLSVTVSNSDEFGVAGAPTSFTVVVRNNSPRDISGAHVTNTTLTTSFFSTPAMSVLYTAVGTPGASGFSADGTSDIDDLVNLPADGSITYTVLATSDPGAALYGDAEMSDQASISGPPGFIDTIPDNNSVNESTFLTSECDVEITITDSAGGSSITGTQGVVAAGDTIVYTLVVTNHGPSKFYSFSIRDLLPPEIASDTYVASFWPTIYPVQSGDLNESPFLSLGPGDSVNYTITAGVDPAASGLLTNTASAFGQSFSSFGDPDFSNNSATIVDRIVAAT